MDRTFDDVSIRRLGKVILWKIYSFFTRNRNNTQNNPFQETLPLQRASQLDWETLFFATMGLLRNTIQAQGELFIERVLLEIKRKSILINLLQ
jgi:hypothetical protein